MTRGRWGSIWLVSTALGMAVLAACESPSAPTRSPSASPPSAPRALDVPPFTVSGTVFENTAGGEQPIAGLQFTLTTLGRPESAVKVDVRSDANGRYEVTGLPPSPVVRLAVSPAQGYRAPCPPGIISLSSNSLLDFHVVSDALLATTGIPESFRPFFPTISGTVSESIPGGAKPVGGVALDLLGDSPESTVAGTLSDAAGHYLICLPPPGGNDNLVRVRALKTGYQTTTQSIVVSFDERLDFELRR